ncbi:hypothetical protein N7491_006294 [Penicillium cf. griseofulvum]|uniref:Uncharacterized protein n=1 Tax=Penicillium cf. griseofulvum TaxID=2972120 RepID=A0A9W9J1J1_9EURO|nr:hypothetical protein N7472_010676 [Penicillium cf. griseofulvum]KAJ5429278.1 hypothetical protein N7491_006294 [Penicillium cf. griseofulvum]KAJ5436928.1 hypothetical protein N7445_007813 [Penicillium cf. griseofulvum]
MQRIDTSSWDIYIAYGNRRRNDTLHWILLLANPGSDRCTWYHVVGGPTQGRPYQPKIEANKRVNNFGIASKVWISRIPASEINKVKVTAQSVPASAGPQKYWLGLNANTWSLLAPVRITAPKSSPLALSNVEA